MKATGADSNKAKEANKCEILRPWQQDIQRNAPNAPYPKQE
jgi:hypothetical protein